MSRTPKADPEKRKKLEQRLAKLQRDLQRAKTVEKEQERRNETRRKAIEGALCETHALKNPLSEFATVYVRLLKEYVRPGDRWLFSEIFRALLPPNEAATLLADTSNETETETLDTVEAAAE